MKVGDRVKHKLSGEYFTIQKLSDSVATCRRDEPVISERFGLEVWTAICAIENLELAEPEKGQLKIPL